MRASLAAVRWALGASVSEAPKKKTDVPAKGATEEGSQDVMEQAWCQQCHRHEFGRFCPKCGQRLVHEVVTPTGHWLLGSDRLSAPAKVKEEAAESKSLVTRAQPESPEVEFPTPSPMRPCDGVSDVQSEVTEGSGTTRRRETDEPLHTPREKLFTDDEVDEEGTPDLEQNEETELPQEDQPVDSARQETEERCTNQPPRRSMMSLLRPAEVSKKLPTPMSKEPRSSPRPKGRFLAFVAHRRHSLRDTPQRRVPSPSAVKPSASAMVVLSPPLKLGKVLRMPKKRLRRKGKAEMTEVPAMQLSEFMGECPCEVFQVFLNFEATNGTEPSGALARLKAAREMHGNDAMQEALQCCAEAILCSGDCRSSFVLVDACIDLLGAAAHEVQSSPGPLLAWLVQRLGGEAKALRDRPARQRAASLLWRLLPEQKDQVSRLILDAATMALLDLAKDKTPAIRLAATRGLSKIPGAETEAMLLQLTRDVTPAVRGAAVSALGECPPPALWKASGRCLDAVVRVRLRFYEAAEKQDVDDLPGHVLRNGLSDGNAEVRAACLSMIKMWASKREPGDALHRLVLAAGADAEKALKALMVLPEWASYRDQIAARSPTDAASALIWRVCTQLAPELPMEAKPLCQQALDALNNQHYDVLREMLRLILEEGEGPTEELAELAMAVLRHCPASCGVVEGTFNVFAMAMALIRRLKCKEELHFFLTQLLDDFRYNCKAQAHRKKSQNLKEKTMKALYVIEAAFSALGKELEDFDLGCNLLEDWLRPAMDRDAEQRTLALRCLALYSSNSCEEAVKHWTFFLELMKSQHAEDEATTEICALFILDVLLLHGSELPAGSAASAFTALRQVLGAPLSDGGPRPLQRRLAERLITILLYGHWDQETEVDASWFLAWLMLEAFRYPAASLPVLNAEVDMEAAKQAAFRGRLLCLFGCMGRASVPHAMRLSSAMQLLLSTDLWHLAIPISQGSRGVQWRAVHLPRLLRLVCQQLAASCATQKRGSNAEDWAQLWLERIWRPLALLCLESPEEAVLTELLSATAFALQPSGASNLAPLQKARNWPNIMQEVLESCHEIAANVERLGVEASFLPVMRQLTSRFSEVQEISASWQAKTEAQQQREWLQGQLSGRRISTQVPKVPDPMAELGSGKRPSLSDDDSANRPPKKKRVARSLFVGLPGGS